MNRAGVQHRRASVWRLLRGESMPAMAVLLVIAGCGRPAGVLFPRLDSPIVFPPPPDAARIEYVGALRTDRDLKPAVSSWGRFTEAIRGSAAPNSVSAPAGLAVSAANRVYVTDPPLRCLHIFDLESRQYRAIFDAGGTPLAAPADVAVAEGRVFLTDAGRATIDVFTESGDYIRTWDGLELTRPVGLAWHAASRRLYVVDAKRHACVAYTLDGREVLRFGGHGDGPGELNYPTYVTADAVLGILIADSLNFRVQRFAPDGTFISAFGQKGDAAGDFSLPKGVAVEDHRYIFAADANFENVQVFDAQGRLMMAFGGEGSDPGRFWLPSKIVIDGQQRLWVADSYNRRVQMFRLLPEPQA
ncbi:MAG: hypothetical protein ACE5F9_11300 [Phycisphaerae bacterium]